MFGLALSLCLACRCALFHCFALLFLDVFVLSYCLFAFVRCSSLAQRVTFFASRLAAATSRIPDVVDPEVEDLILDCIKKSKEVMAQCPGPITTRPARAVMFIVKMGKSIYPQGKASWSQHLLLRNIYWVWIPRGVVPHLLCDWHGACAAQVMSLFNVLSDTSPLRHVHLGNTARIHVLAPLACSVHHTFCALPCGCRVVLATVRVVCFPPSASAGGWGVEARACAMAAMHRVGGCWGV